MKTLETLHQRQWLQKLVIEMEQWVAKKNELKINQHLFLSTFPQACRRQSLRITYPFFNMFCIARMKRNHLNIIMNYLFSLIQI